ncbi:hypothetical protein BTHE68_50870 [Burkholderia sp. THE68]|nr:hypothetical protein BTHE68_50870 [Burkholderia sp. THE68]
MAGVAEDVHGGKISFASDGPGLHFRVQSTEHRKETIGNRRSACTRTSTCPNTRPGALLETLVHQDIRTTADLPDTYRPLRVAVGERVEIAELAKTVSSIFEPGRVHGDRYNPALMDVLDRA